MQATQATRSSDGASPAGTPPRLAPLLLFLAGLAVYWGILVWHRGEWLPQSSWPYFTYYARTLLDGQLHFGALPPARLDLVVFEGRTYMHHPPFPALLLAPFVAAFGLAFPDRWLGAVLGALNGALLHALLGALDRRGVLRTPEPMRLLLCVFFLFGSVHFYLSVTGNPWELAHVLCNTLVLLSLGLVLRGRYALAAVAWVAVLFTRSHVFAGFAVPLGLAWWLEGRAGRAGGARAAALLPALAIGAAGVGLLLAFNAARFGDPFESGVSFHALHAAFRERFERHGYFDWSYLPRNLYVLLLAAPRLQPAFPFLGFSGEGQSLFLTSPLYLYLLRSLRRPGRPFAALLWCGVIPALVPILLVMGTGELQFGHRYSSDLQVYLVLLTALGMGGRVTAPAWALAAASVAMNAAGAAWFVSTYSE